MIFHMIFQCDLAARNVLVTHDLQFKITDFGLSERDYFDLTIAPAKSNATLQPICWLAYEVLQSKGKVYESDVWSFGVYMWEVFEFGCGKPYVFLKDEKGRITSNKLVEYFEEGHRLPMPELCPGAIHDLMQQCWELEPSERPAFWLLKKQLEALSGSVHQLTRPRYDKVEEHYVHVLDILQDEEDQTLLPQPPQFTIV